MKLTSGQKITAIVLCVLIIDQVVKIWIKTHMLIGEHINVFGKYFQILFIENNGAAFGMQLGGMWGKFILTSLRLVMIAFIIFYARKLIKRGAPAGVLAGLALILAGAIGNIIDSLFYGLIFSESTSTQLASLFTDGGGYAPLFFGKVVDMLYFPLIHFYMPQNAPFWAGEEILFFRPIFNIADSAITIGIFYLILFHRKFFASK